MTITTSKTTIKTWKWRIVKAGFTSKGFAAELQIPPSLVSEYLSGKKTPSLARFDLIEGKLQSLGV